jgi:hypothetical protein
MKGVQFGKILFAVDGIVDTAPGLVRVMDPERLAAIVRAFVI